MGAFRTPRALALTVTLLGGGLALPVQAATDATQWLGRLADAEQHQSYAGTFIYERSGSFSTHDIWHRVVNGQITERLLQLDGSPIESVRVDGAARCINGESSSVAVNPTPAAEQRLDPLKLMSWYTLSKGASSRVAGRDAQVVTLRPKDQQRYALELYLDKQTGLTLKSLLIGERGQLLERFQFTRFSPGIPTDAELAASDACRPAVAAFAATGTAAANWRIDWLPAGFELGGSSVHLDPERKVPVSSLIYGDGLARLSIFVEPLNGASQADSRLQLGPTAVVSRHLGAAGEDMLVTVVGEVPMGTAERVALSVRAVGTR